ncbi:MAG: iron-containing alcohol dehydrogenase [Nitrospirae bacterium]|nr:iron-containing alcohol dehydrogenase [Nitrospirota bacterium]
MMPSLVRHWPVSSHNLKKIAFLLLLGASVAVISILVPSNVSPTVSPLHGQTQELAGWMIQAVAQYDRERHTLLKRQIGQLARQINQFTQNRTGRLQEQFGQAIVQTHQRIRAEWMHLRAERAATARALDQIIDTRSAQWQEQLGRTIVTTAQRVPEGGAAFQAALQKNVAHLRRVAERAAARLSDQLDELTRQQADFPSLIALLYKEAIASAGRSARMFDEGHLAWATRVHAELDQQVKWQRPSDAYAQLELAARSALTGPAGAGGFIEFGLPALAGLVFVMAWCGTTLRKDTDAAMNRKIIGPTKPLLREHDRSDAEADTMRQPVLLFSWPKEVVFGVNVSATIGRYAAKDRVHKALLITDRNLHDRGLLEPLKASCSGAGIGWTVYDEVAHEAPDTNISKACETCRHTAADLIVAVGGGSVIDTAKAVGILVTNGGRLQDYEGLDKVPSPPPHFYAVPTTAGCGSETSQFCVALDTAHKRKLEIISRRVIPQMIFIDPALMLTMSPELTAGSGIDALTNAIEAYCSTWASPLTDTLALHAIRLIAGALRVAVSNGANLEARRQMAVAAFEAGLAFNNAQCGAAHALGHPIAGLLNVPERLSEGILLPHVMRYNLRAGMAPRLAEVAGALGERVEDLDPQAAAERAVIAVQWLLSDIGLPATLDKIGVAKEAIPELTRQAAQDTFLRTNPRTLHAQEIEHLYLRAFEEQAWRAYASVNRWDETVH